MRIPTLVGLGLLVLLLGLGILLIKNYQQRFYQDSLDSKPENIKQVNITSSSATITWQTKKKALGSISWSNDQSLNQTKNDDRDQSNPKPRLTHFVTLDNLQPSSKYFFRIQNDQFIYPQTLEFTTAKVDNQSLTNKPIIGSVVDSEYQPADDGLVFLKLEGGSELATYTLPTGNFLLPTTQLRTSNLEQEIDLSSSTQALLEISKGELNSQIKISLPPPDTPLPQVVLGQNSDLSYFLASVPLDNNPFDLNNDDQLNALDLSIVLNNFGKRPKLPEADVNRDGVVDQKDLDELKALFP